MRITHVVSAVSLMVSLLSPAFAENLITNPGFDQTAAKITLSAVNPGDAGWADSDTFPGWQCYAFGPATPGSCSYEAKADAGAVSAPNVFVYTKESAVADSAVRREVVQAPVVAGHTYKHSIYARDIDGSINSHDVVTALFGSTGFLGTFGGVTHEATTLWERVEGEFVAVAGATSASFQFHLIGATGSLQFDSAALEDVTKGNRMTNGSFEDSSAKPLNWTAIDAGGRAFQAQIVSDAAEGNRAARIFQTNAPTGDGILSKDGGHWLPWSGADKMQLSYSLKDDPTLATGEAVTVQVVAFNAANAGTSVFIDNRTPGTGSYARFDEVITNLPADTVNITVNFRVGAVGAVGDVLVDDVAVYDLTVSSKATVDATALDLGTGDIKTGPVTKDILIQSTNTGGGDLVVGNLAITGANAAAFSAALVEGASPVAPGSSVKVRVTFTPTVTGGVPQNAQLAITHDAINLPNPLVIPLSAISVPVTLSEFSAN